MQEFSFAIALISHRAVASNVLCTNLQLLKWMLAVINCSKGAGFITVLCGKGLLRFIYFVLRKWNCKCMEQCTLRTTVTSFDFVRMKERTKEMDSASALVTLLVTCQRATWHEFYIFSICVCPSLDEIVSVITCGIYVIEQHGRSLQNALYSVGVINWLHYLRNANAALVYKSGDQSPSHSRHVLSRH